MAQRILLGGVLFLFLAQTVRVLAGIGFVGFFESANLNEATRLMFLDLVITLVLITVWMSRDAAAAGRRFWPYAALTLTLGSAGPLVYLLGKTCGTRCEIARGRSAAPPRQTA